MSLFKKCRLFTKEKALPLLKAKAFPYLSDHFAYVWLAAMLLGLLICTVVTILAEIDLPIFGLLFNDVHDVGMDHFNSILVTANRRPYTDHHITYPPLAAMLYYFFFLLLDKSFAASFVNGTAASTRELRGHSSAMIPFMMLALLCFVLAACLIHHNLKTSPRQRTAAVLGLLLCGSTISALDRGNNVFLLFLLLLFYLFYYDSENKVLAELALVALALATGLKLYPIVFGVLLIRKHKIWQGMRALLYIAAAILLPFFFFEGVDAMQVWFSSFLGARVKYIHPGGLNLASAIDHFEVVLGFTVPEALTSAFTLLFIVLGVLGAIAYREDYKAALYCAVAIVGLAGVNFRYTCLFTLLPVLMLFQRRLRGMDWLYAVLLLLLNIPLVTATPEWLWGTNVQLMTLLNGALVVLLMAILLVDSVIDLIAYIKEKKWKYLFKTERQMKALEAENGTAA